MEKGNGCLRHTTPYFMAFFGGAYFLLIWGGGGCRTCCPLRPCVKVGGTEGINSLRGQSQEREGLMEESETTSRSYSDQGAAGDERAAE